MSSFSLKTFNPSEKPALRVTVLDAIDLDTEIQRILKEQLLKIFHNLSPSLGRWEPELDTLLRIAVWKMSLYEGEATFGQQLLSVKYGREMTPRRACVWAALTIGSHYLRQRSSKLTSLLAQSVNSDQVSLMLSWVELAVLVASALNSLVFLQQGVFPSLADRLVGLRPVSAHVSAARVVGYSFMTRELLWHGFIELIVFILPLVNYKAVERWGRKWLGQRRRGDKAEALVYTVATRCAVCLQPPVLPHHMGCSHAFCYYCVQSTGLADSKFECPVCGLTTEDHSVVQPVSRSCCVDV